MSKPIIFWLSVLFLFSGAAVVWSALKIAQRHEVRSGAQAVVDSTPTSKEKLTEFTLTERSGKKFQSADLKGQVWIASFFYASCPGTCRAQNMEVMALQNKFATKGVKFVSITCDPRTDTPGKLREYAESFHAKADSWYFLTGDLKYIQRIGAEIFNVWVQEKVHMERLMAVDKWGNVRGYFDWKNPAEVADMKKMLDELLVEQSPPKEITPKMSDTPNFKVPGSEEAEAQSEEKTSEE